MKKPTIPTPIVKHNLLFSENVGVMVVGINGIDLGIVSS
ncbi:hypothetical protein RINTHM_1530 [Richelia intracellularis HM01]|nr:hypothetical protein RINTHM_1530 [Richelia intracellularis HM01]